MRTRLTIPWLLAPLALASCRAPAALASAPELARPELAENGFAETGRDAALALALDHATWEREGARLAAESPGAWVLIVAGEVHGPWTDFEEAFTAADERAGDADHAYLYRAGVDDVDVTFLLSPFVSDRPNDPGWVQLGRRFQRPQRFTIAAVGNVWGRNGKQVAWGDEQARLRLEAPGSAGKIEVRGCASQMFEQDLTLRASDAESLGLGRITAPGRAWYVSEKWPCEKAVVRLRIPELDVDGPAVAFVLPGALTD